jgi:hypothetical protein
MTRAFAKRWDHKLNVSDVFNNDDLTMEQKRDKIVARIKASAFYKPDDYELDEIVDELSQVDDEDYFDLVWNAFYDWCDIDKRVWIETQ